MAYAISELTEKAQHWVRQMMAAHYLSEEQAEPVLKLDQRLPDDLFVDNAARPLIVAFMGGTGVGKSSLLNRLAGEAIAKTGIERPTSREVTLYHHDSIQLQQLPPSLPLNKVKICAHHDGSKRRVVWIDMPDFDSIELTNQQLVFNWLPHIDVLIYVVSPERYRDKKAWQLLLAEGLNHAWLFVMNQWDRGQQAQWEDFKHQLQQAGFNDPLIFTTVCGEDGQSDQFDALVGQLNQLADSNAAASIEQRGRTLRLQQLWTALQQCQKVIDAYDYDRLLHIYRSRWEKTVAMLQEGLRWPTLQLATAYVRQGSGQNERLWDDWAQSRCDDLLDEILLQAQEQQLPAKALQHALSELRGNIADEVQKQAELACRHALVRPGNSLQRLTLRLMQVAEVILPLTAMGGVGFKVFEQFYQGAMLGERYLGTDFAVHAVLLIALSWLLPFFLHKKLQPSLEKAAIKGVQKGVDQALAQLDATIAQTIKQQQRTVAEQGQQLARLLSACEHSMATMGRDDIDNEALQRLLMQSAIS